MIPVAAPALPLDEAGKYVAGAYLVFLALLLIYVAIMSVRLGRVDRELGELANLAENRQARVGNSGEAAVGKGPGLPSLSGALPAESGPEAEHLGGGIHG
jgi:hypothetical protein